MRRRTGAALAVLVLVPGAAGAADVAAGRAKARTCAVCHGELGLSRSNDAPNLAGQPEVYIVQQLHHFRGGERKHAVMSVMAKTLSDDDIDALAAWYASLVIEVKPPN